jgi:hypothetical protein
MLQVFGTGLSDEDVGATWTVDRSPIDVLAKHQVETMMNDPSMVEHPSRRSFLGNEFGGPGGKAATPA